MKTRLILAMTIATSLAGCSTIGTGRGADFLVASINHSEWNNPDFVSINLETGSFRWSSHTGRVRYGRIEPTALVQIGNLLANAKYVGFGDPGCVSIPRSERTVIILSNGGQVYLQLRQKGPDLVAPVDLECWTKEAKSLQDAVAVEINRTIFPATS